MTRRYFMFMMAVAVATANQTPLSPELILNELDIYRGPWGQRVRWAIRRYLFFRDTGEPFQSSGTIAAFTREVDRTCGTRQFCTLDTGEIV